MIIVNSPLMHDEIKDELTTTAAANFEFVKEEGIKLYFKTDQSPEEAAKLAKKLIKARVGDLVLFKVRTEEYI